MSALSERKVDCHCHVLDPVQFPYANDVAYRPAAQEIGTRKQFDAVCDSYGVAHALLVGPNSGYGTDNRCLLDAIARGRGRYKGIAVVANDIATPQLAALRAQGIVGVAINATYHGVDYYRDIGALIDRLADLDLFLQIQVEGDQLTALMPAIARARVRILVDHCGRPNLANGMQQTGFRDVLALGTTGRAVMKLSGLQKFSQHAFPYDDTWPWIRALVDAYGLDRCVWGSDWPFLRATERLDYGPLLSLVDLLFPDAHDRARLLWDTPRKLFGFV